MVYASICGIRALRQYGHDARVKAAGEKARYRNVRHEVRSHRVLDHHSEVVTGLSGRSCLLDHVPVALNMRRAIWTELCPGARLELLYTAH